MHARLHSWRPTLQKATANPCLRRRLLDIHGPVWVSLLWGHCSFLPGPSAHKFLFVSSKSLFPLSCVISGTSMVGLMATSSKRALHTQVCCAKSPRLLAAYCWPVSPQETLKHCSVSVSCGLWVLVCTRFDGALTKRMLSVKYSLRV